jgi:hypothetical protein
MAQKFDARQVISRDALSNLLGISGTELDDLLRAANKEFNSPVRMSASIPADAKINFTASAVEAADLAEKNISPIANLVPTLPATTIDFQSGAVTGGTVNISFPNSTVGFFRRVGFTLLSNGSVDAVFSPEVAAEINLANPGTLFTKGGTAIGWIDLEATAASPGRFKTIGSSTNIIQNKPSSVSRVHRIVNTSGSDQARVDVASAASLTSADFTSSAVKATVIKVTGAIAGNIHGITASSDAKQFILYNATNTTQTIVHQSGTEGTAANRIVTANSGSVVVNAGESAIFLYDSTQSRWVLASVSGSGSGVGFKNILSSFNSAFESGLQDWVTYNDASAIPVDGTGGTASDLTITTTTVGGEILAGLRSLKISKIAANGQGEGASVASLTIDREDRGKPFYVSLSVDATHANYLPGDLKLYAYDITNSRLLNVFNNDSNGNVNKSRGRIDGVIYTEDSTAQVRFMLHVASTNALAWDVFVDSVVITPQANVVSSPAKTTVINDTGVSGNFLASTSGGPTHTATIVKDKFVIKEFSDRTDFFYELDLSGSSTAGGTGYYLIPIKGYTWPAGMSVISGTFGATLTTAIANEFSNNRVWLNAGVSFNYAAAATNSIVGGKVVPISLNGLAYIALVDLWTLSNSATKFALGNSVGSAYNLFGAANVRMSINFSANYSNVGATAIMSQNDAGLQTSRFIGEQVSQAVTGNVTNLTLTSVKDNYQGWNGTQYRIPKNGDYLLMFSAASSVISNYVIYRNNVIYKTVGANAGVNFPETAGTILDDLTAGDLISIRFPNNTTITNGRLVIYSLPDFNVFGVQGPVVVQKTTDWVDGGEVGLTSTGGGVVKGTRSRDKVWWRRVGSDMEVRLEYVQTATGTAGSGDYLFAIPSGYQIDLAKIITSTSLGICNTNSNVVGNVHVGNNVNTGFGSVSVYSTTQVRFMSHTNAGTTVLPIRQNFYPTSDTNVVYAAMFRVPIVGWTPDERLYPTQRVIGTTYLKDVKANNTAPAALSVGSYAARQLNTQEGDTGFCSLASNQFTLQPGTYEFYAEAPMLTTSTGSAAKAKLRNVTDSVDVLIGSSAVDINIGLAGNQDSDSSRVIGRFTITAAKVFELQMRASAAAQGGTIANFGDSEVYAQVKIEKIY